MICYYCGQRIEAGEGDHCGLHIPCFLEWFSVGTLLEFQDVIRKATGTSDSDNADEDQITSSFFQGKFRKYAARLGNSSYILKVREDDYPELPAAEYLCNQIASDIGVIVPEYNLISFHGAVTFVVKNFIQPGKIETMHHIYHFLNGNPFNCRTLLSIIEKRTGRLFEMERFVFLCLYDSLVGNHDRHGRNLALIEEAGQYRLAPFYDNPSYIGIEESGFLKADHSPRGKIATERTVEPVMTDYVEEFRGLGYENVVEKFRSSVKFERILQLSGWGFLSKERSKSLKKLIKKRIGQMNDE